MRRTGLRSWGWGSVVELSRAQIRELRAARWRWRRRRARVVGRHCGEYRARCHSAIQSWVNNKRICSHIRLHGYTNQNFLFFSPIVHLFQTFACICSCNRGCWPMPAKRNVVLILFSLLDSLHVTEYIDSHVKHDFYKIINNCGCAEKALKCNASHR